MDLISYIIILFFLTVVSISGLYFFMSIMGPRRLEEIQKLIDAGRIREAIGHLEKLLEKDERNMKARYLLALSHKKDGNHPAAVLEFRQCIKVGRFGPEVPEIQVRKELGESLIQVGNRNEAKNEFIILTTIQPDNYENYYQVGKLFYGAGVYSKAIHFLQKATQLNGNHGDSLALLGQAQFHIGAYQDARNTLSRAVQLKSDQKTARYYFGLALRFTGDLEWALKELEKAEKEESIRDKVLLAKGMVLIDQENYPMAIAELEKGLKATSSNGETAIQIRYLIGLASEKNRDIHKAIEHWEQIDKYRPGYRDVKEKLRQYSEFKTDDSMKDFMIASAAQFEGICRRIVESLHFSITQINLVSDSKLYVLASEEDKLQIGARNKFTLFWIQRDMNAITDGQIRDFQVRMRENNAGKGIIITTGEFTPGAINFAGSRPLDIYDSARTTELLRSLEQ